MFTCSAGDEPDSFDPNDCVDCAPTCGCESETGIEYLTYGCACAPYTLWHDAAPNHCFCPETVVAGCDSATDCLGECGPGCLGVNVYTIDCAEHDRCCRAHGGCLNPFDAECGDEFDDAADDTLFGIIISCGDDCGSANPFLVPSGTLPQPNSTEPGNQITLSYAVSNPSPVPHDLFLGASIRPASGGTFINSIDCEGCASNALVTIQGDVDQLFSRCFTIPASAEPGLYEVCYAIWDPLSCGPGTQYDSFCRNDLAVLALPCDDQCGSWVPGSCGGGPCAAAERLFTRTCPAGCGPTEDCRFDDSCVDDPDPCQLEPCPCDVPGYDQCTESVFEDCTVSIAVNYYSNVNDIRWGAVVDSSDPYVVGQYKVGWTAVDAEKMYYGIDPSTCDYGGCSGEQVSLTGTRVTVVAPGTAHAGLILGYDDTTDWACWVWFNAFNPNYGAGNPLYVLRCFDDSDCGAQRCDKSASWQQWACVDRKADGVQCGDNAECISGFCDNDGIGLGDDGWCFTPSNTYFDGQEPAYCEVSTGTGSALCDERQVGDVLNQCIGIPFREDQCSGTCSEVDITDVFECNEVGCLCEEPLCDGLTVGDNLATCSSGLPYFADKCTAIARGEDRGDNICRSSAFAPGCSGAVECNGVVAGTGSCSLACQPDVCGNGVVGPDEACDDGNTVDCDGCRANCSAVETGCGDGFICGAEFCDDGNNTDCDGCRADCAAIETGCGDGFVCGAEACDDGNNTDCDGCRADCSAVETGCGDGFVCGAEACDDGNNVDCDGCRADCSAIETGCGDGFVCGIEECDGTNDTACPGACLASCRCPGCDPPAESRDPDPADGATDVPIDSPLAWADPASVTERASLDSAGQQANSQSLCGSINADGRYVLFDSYASNLVVNDTNAQQDLFIRDRWTGNTDRVSVSSGGVQADGPSWRGMASADGRFVVFHSGATNLVPGDTNGAWDVFIRDRLAGLTERVSVSSSGDEGDAASGRIDGLPAPSSISADGRYVAFASEASNLVAGDTNQAVDVFVRDRSAATTTRASVISAGLQGLVHSHSPSISWDGRNVAFASWAPAPGFSDANGANDVFVYDRLTGDTTLVTVTDIGTVGNGPSFHPAISGDGRYVVFGSSATDLVPGDTNTAVDVFVRDLVLEVTELVTVNSEGVQADNEARGASISGSGRYVAFHSGATNLVLEDLNGFPDVFVRDRLLGITERVSISSAETEGDWSSFVCEAALDADAHHVVFGSLSTNLVPDDTNGTRDIFVRTRGRSEPCQTTYDVYLGTDATCSTLTRICADLAKPTCGAGLLGCGTTYYWQVVAKNIVGETLGPCWSFTTEGCCGDGNLKPGEECDDGNVVDCDGCDATCVMEFCGDGVLCQALGEACDDGNTAPCDGCDAACVIEFCGDGVLCQALGEECDHGDTDNCDGCDSECIVEECGNDKTQCNEECDGTDAADCSGSCQVDCTCEPCTFTFTIGGAVYTDCPNPLTSGELDVQVTATGTGGTFTATAGGPSGIWQIPDVPCGTYTVTPEKPCKEFCHVAHPCPPRPDPCISWAEITVDEAHQGENLSIQFLAKDACIISDMNCDGICTIVWDVDCFVQCVYYGDCTADSADGCTAPDGYDLACPADCNCDGMATIVFDVECFVEDVYSDGVCGECPQGGGAAGAVSSSWGSVSAGFTVGGAVYDDEVNPLLSGIGGVAVDVLDVDGGIVTSTETAGPMGIWRIDGLPEGIYTVVFAHKDGRASREVDSITITVNASNRAGNQSIRLLRAPNASQPPEIRRVAPAAKDRSKVGRRSGR